MIRRAIIARVEMAAPLKKQQNSRASVAQAQALTRAATKQAQIVRETVTELLDASKKVAATTSEVLGGVVGAALGVAGGTILFGLSSAVTAAIPFLGVAGLGLGVLVVRGRRGVAQDRETRGRVLNREQDL